MRDWLARVRADRPAPRPVLVLTALVALIITVVGAYAIVQAASLGTAWQSVERVSLDDDVSDEGPSAVTEPETESSRSAPTDAPATSTTATTTGIPTESTTTDRTAPSTPPTPAAPWSPTTSTTITPSTTAAETTTTVTQPPLETGDVPPAPEVVALIGTDSRDGLDDMNDFGDFGARNADVIVMAIREGDRITLLSVPRDLYVPDRCHGGMHRIGEAMNGCDGTHGLVNVVRELESLTGLEVAHAAAVDLAGFQTIVDALGGYEICTDHPLRDSKSGLSLPAGCTDADGATTLAWIRSRRTQQKVDGRWQTVPAVSDLTRNERQRIFMVDMFERIAADSDPRTILGVLREAAPHLTVDDGLSLREAAVWAWRFRGADVETADIPVADHRTTAGAAVLVPTVDVAAHVAELTR